MAQGREGAATADQAGVRAYLDYFRDMGVYDFYRNGELPAGLDISARKVSAPAATPAPASAPPYAAPPTPAPAALPLVAPEPLIPKLISFNDLAALPVQQVTPAARAAGLASIRADIGDCTRCPLAYAGRRNIVFGEGDPNATLMFIGEGPGADEDETGKPFIGKSGQLLGNMIQAMGLTREQVYIANIVKCRPPANRAPEYIEATTCTQFLLRQIDTIQPKFIVALGMTAASYLLGTRQSLTSLRGQWHPLRGAQAVVTFHPAYLLRDPRQKGEAWKDLQMVMAAMNLTPAKKS